MKKENKEKKKFSSLKYIFFILIAFIICYFVGIIAKNGNVSSLEGYMYSLATDLVGATPSDATSGDATSSNATSCNATSSNATSSNATSSNSSSVVNSKAVQTSATVQTTSTTDTISNLISNTNSSENEITDNNIISKEMGVIEPTKNKVSFLESHKTYIIIIAASVLVALVAGIILIIAKIKKAKDIVK